MKIKVQCQCGSRFEFDIEPINGRMPQTIACPSCGADATELANEAIQEQSPAAPRKAPLRISVARHAPSAAAPAEQAPPPAPAPASGLRIAKVHQSASHAPSPAEKAPAAPAAQSSLRIARAHHPEPAAAPAASNEAHGGVPCAKHPNEASVEKCRVCGKPICLKCMDLFGYVCSVYCRGQANAQKIPVPVYKNQKSQLAEKAGNKARQITIAVSLLIVAAIGAWIWYAFFASQPKVVYSVKLSKSDYYGSEFKLIGPGQMLSLVGKRLELYDAAKDKQVWSTPLPEPPPAVMPASLPAPTAKGGAKTNASPLAAALRPAGATGVKPAAASPGEDDSDNDDGFAFSSGFYGRPTVIPTTNDIWLLFHDRIEHFDRQTGARKDPVSLPQPVVQLIHNDEIIFAVSATNSQHRLLTQVNLLSGATQTEDIDLNPKPAAAAGDRTKKPVAAAAKKPAPGTQSAAISEQIEDHFHPAGNNVAEMSVKLLERKSIVTDAIKPKGKSLVDSGNLTASQSLDATQEMLNDMHREQTGGKSVEDVSRYEVTLKRWMPKGAPDWKGEVEGPPAFFPLQTVDVLASGRGIIVFDKSNKKLWDAKLTYPFVRVGGEFDFGQEMPSPCLEANGTLYFADRGMLTSFDLSTGAVHWRVTSVGISRVQLDDKGQIYLSTTTAGPDSIQYSQQIDFKHRPDPQIVKIDAPTGKKLWEVTKIGASCYVSGKFAYAGKTAERYALLRLEEGPESYFNFYRLNASNGNVEWTYYQPKAGLDADVSKNWILLRFRDEVQVLKFLSL